MPEEFFGLTPGIVNCDLIEQRQALGELDLRMLTRSVIAYSDFVYAPAFATFRRSPHQTAPASPSFMCSILALMVPSLPRSIARVPSGVVRDVGQLEQRLDQVHCRAGLQ